MNNCGGATIKRAAQGYMDSAYGYIWKFVEETE